MKHVTWRWRMVLVLCTGCLVGATKPATKPTDEAQAAADQVRKDLAHVALYIKRTREAGDKPGEFDSLTLRVPYIEDRRRPGWQLCQIDEAQAGKIVNALLADGFFDRALAGRLKKRSMPAPPFYEVILAAGDEQYADDPGYAPTTLARLKAIRAALDGEPAKAMDRLLEGFTPRE